MAFADFVRQEPLLAFMGEPPATSSLAWFVNDAFGADKLAEARDQIAHIAAEQRLLAELKAEENTLPAWRDGERVRLVQELAQLPANPEPVRENEFGKRWTIYRIPIRLVARDGPHRHASVYDRDVEEVSRRATVSNVRVQKWVSLSSSAQLKEVSFEQLLFTNRLLHLKITFRAPVQVWPDKYDRHAKPRQSYYEMLEVVPVYTSAAWEDADAARILALFRRLQRLDEAGNDPAQLQVRKHAR